MKYTFDSWVSDNLNIGKLRDLLLAWIKDEWRAADEEAKKRMSDIMEIILTQDLREVLKDPKIVSFGLLDSAVFLKSQIETIYNSGRTGKLE